MVISMRNKLILFLIIFIMGISSVNAYTTTNAKCVSDRSCMCVIILIKLKEMMVALVIDMLQFIMIIKVIIFQ